MLFFSLLYEMCASKILLMVKKTWSFIEWRFHTIWFRDNWDIFGLQFSTLILDPYLNIWDTFFAKSINLGLHFHTISVLDMRNYPSCWKSSWNIPYSYPFMSSFQSQFQWLWFCYSMFLCALLGLIEFNDIFFYHYSYASAI